MRVIFIDKVHDVLEQMLTDAGFECVHNYSGNKAEIQANLGNADGVVIRSRIPVDRAFFESAPQLKFIARAGAGLENIDLETAKARNVQVFNVPKANRDAVGEHALGMLLMLMNHLKRADAEVRSGLWRRAENRGTEILGKTVGIVGFGQMGSAFAEKLRGFGCKIIAYDKYHSIFPDYVSGCTLETLQQEADIISLHVPYTEETHYLFDAGFIAQSSKPFYLINTARGKVVNTADLVAGLQENKIAGACLDVLEYEARSFENIDANQLPEPFQFLIQSEQVILSPHIGGWTHESHYKLSQFLGDFILEHFPPKNPNRT